MKGGDCSVLSAIHFITSTTTCKLSQKEKLPHDKLEKLLFFTTKICALASRYVIIIFTSVHSIVLPNVMTFVLWSSSTTNAMNTTWYSVPPLSLIRHPVFVIQSFLAISFSVQTISYPLIQIHTSHCVTSNMGHV